MGLAERVAINAAAQLVGQFLVLAGGLVAVAVTTRYLGLRDYGSLVTALVFVSLFALVTDFGATTIGARELAKRPLEARSIISSLGIGTTAISVLTVMLALAATFLVYSGPGDEKIRLAILVLLPQLLLSGFNTSAQSFLIAEQKIYLASLARVLARILTLGLVLLVAWASLGYLAMVAAYLSYPVVGVLGTFLFARPGMTPWRTFDRGVAMTILRASAPLGGVIVVNYLYFRLDLFLLSILATRADVARYGVAYKVVEALVLLPSYLMLTLLPDIAREQPFSQRLSSLVQNAFAAMQFIAIPLVALSFYSTQIMVFLGGANYAQAGFALQILLISVAIGFFQQALSYTLVARDKQTQTLFVLAAVLVLNLVLNLILIPPFGINGAAFATLASECASLAGMAYAYSRIGPVPRLHAPVGALLAGAVMVALVLGTRTVLGHVSSSPFPTLAVGGSISVLVYAFAVSRLGGLPPAASEAISGILRRRIRHA